MSTSTGPVTSPDTSAVDRLDLDLTLASVGLGVARARFLRCGSAANARLLDEAVAAVDRLLDERLATVRAGSRPRPRSAPAAAGPSRGRRAARPGAAP